jgi:hypothetical protein
MSLAFIGMEDVLNARPAGAPESHDDYAKFAPTLPLKINESGWGELGEQCGIQTA